jgi:hypothetical protein
VLVAELPVPLHNLERNVLQNNPRRGQQTSHPCSDLVMDFRAFI